MTNEDRFKYQVGDKVMGIPYNIPIAGTIIGRKSNMNCLMYIISDIDEPDNPAINSVLEERHLIPYDGFKWKQSTVFWKEGNDFIEKGESYKSLAAELLSDKSRFLK